MWAGTRYVQKQRRKQYDMNVTNGGNICWTQDLVIVYYTWIVYNMIIYWLKWNVSGDFMYNWRPSMKYVWIQ